MQHTANYNLNLPEGADPVDVEALNSNAEVIDLEMAQIRVEAERPRNWSEIIGKPSSYPSSDVYPWAKASNKPTYSPSEVGTLSSTTIYSMNQGLDERVTALEEGGSNVTPISDNDIKALFDNPVN